MASAYLLYWCWDVARTVASGADVGARDDMQYTALHWVAVNGHVNIGRLLLERGADVDALNDRERTLCALSISPVRVVACTPACTQRSVRWSC